MAVPAEVPLTPERLSHQQLDQFPVRLEVQVVNSKYFHRAVTVSQNPGPHKAMIKTHDQWLQAEFLDQRPQGESTVLTPRKWNDAIVVIFATILLDQRFEFTPLRIPINSTLHVLVQTYVADALIIEDDCFVSLRQKAECAPLQTVSTNLVGFSHSVIPYGNP